MLSANAFTAAVMKLDDNHFLRCMIENGNCRQLSLNSIYDKIQAFAPINNESYGREIVIIKNTQTNQISLNIFDMSNASLFHIYEQTISGIPKLDTISITVMAVNADNSIVALYVHDGASSILYTCPLKLNPNVLGSCTKANHSPAHQIKSLAIDSADGLIYALEENGVIEVYEYNTSTDSSTVWKKQITLFVSLKPAAIAFEGKTKNLYVLTKTGIYITDGTTQGEKEFFHSLSNPQSLALYEDDAYITDGSRITKVNFTDNSGKLVSLTLPGNPNYIGIINYN